MRRLYAALLLLGLLPCAQAAAEEELRLLSYNVHGLPALFVEDEPRDRSPTIGWLSEPYDVILFQEDFEYARHIGRQLPDHHPSRGNGIGWDPRRLLAKGLLAPAALFIPNFWPPYGAGLTSYVRREVAMPEGDLSEAFRACHGWFSHKSDCWSRKGFQRVGVRTRSGVEIHVYNTHLDAGSSPGDIEARRAQFAQMGEAAVRLSAGVPVVMAGDLNTDYARPADRELLLEIAAQSSLRSTGAAGTLPHWKDRDFIMVADGKNARLRVIEAGEDLRFSSPTRTLSDHPAIFARILVEKIEAADDPEPEP